jgi:hypothetical protein
MSKGQFGVRIANNVMDPKHSEKGEKRFETWMPEHERIEELRNLTNRWFELKNIVYNI